MIGITGAAGDLGRIVVEDLLTPSRAVRRADGVHAAARGTAEG